MFKRILVPLDGSERAERAIRVAARIARTTGGSITFLRVVTAAIDAAWSVLEAAPWMQQAVETDQARAMDYLTRIASAQELAGIETHTQVLSGVPAEHILSVMHAQQIDLLVMGSHGATGFKRWALGSVAQHIARQSPVPVLVLHERGGVPTHLLADGGRSVRVLVALDGSPLAEAALAPAASLSTALSAPAPGALHVVRVLPFPKLEDESQKDMFLAARKQAEAQVNAYLATVTQRLHEGELATLPIQITSSVVSHTDVAETLIHVAETGAYMEDAGAFNGYDAIAMATHGRSGVGRWIMGSVTERVLGTTTLPLLIVRPQRTASHREARPPAEVVEQLAEGQSWVAMF